MEEPKDKRTKAWKEWKKNFDEQNSVGLGDVVEKVTNATGIKKLVETFTPEGKDCGCDKRKEKLNSVRMRFPVVRCFTEQQYNDWTKFISRSDKNSVTRQHQTGVIIPIYKQLFARQLKPMSCCVKPYIEEIQRVYDKY